MVSSARSSEARLQASYLTDVPTFVVHALDDAPIQPTDPALVESKGKSASHQPQHIMPIS